MKRRPLGYAFLKLVAIGAFGITGSLSLAQNTETSSMEPATQKVEITGSAIKRIPQEGALPVQTFTSEDIKKTGAQSTAEFLQALPAMQGFTAESNSVNGSGAGQLTASIHAIGDKYTLVLVDGRRFARIFQNSSASVNVGSIPLAAIDRVEVLTDGASALYGSDAIAGVVNFILKKETQEGTASANYSSPFQQGGGRTWEFSVAKGFGNIEKDHYNVFLSYGHDEQSSLDASRRDFANSGVVPFSSKGNRYVLYQLSSNTAPAGVTLHHADGTVTQFSPNYYADGKCGPNTFLVTVGTAKYCKYDYASTVQLIPKSVRDSFTVSANYKINEQTMIFADALISRYAVKAKYAAPAQPLSLSTTGTLYNTYVTPHLAALGEDPAKVTSASMGLRLVDAGGREDLYRTDSQHYVLGIEGNGLGWDYNSSYTHSYSKSADIAEGGYSSSDTFQALVAAGTFNPFAAPGTSAGVIAPAVLHSTLDHSFTSLDIFGLRGSRDLFSVPGGTAQLATGFDVLNETYQDKPSAILQSTNALQPAYTDAIIGGNSGSLPIKASRLNYGLFVELLAPLHKTIDVTGSVRYDAYNKVRNSSNFDTAGNPLATANQGKAASDFTYKLSTRWQPHSMLLVRGSYGTGFRAPILTDIATPLQANGVTTGTYTCPMTSPNCQGTAQYDQLLGGNSLSGSGALKPETSQQGTLGFRLEPVKGLSLGLDYWQVEIKNQIALLQENVAFNNASLYPDSFTDQFYDAVQKQKVVAFKQTPLNLAKARYRGIDWDSSYAVQTAPGLLGFQWTGTYMIQADQEYPGVGRRSSLGRFGADNKVVFYVITRGAISLKTSDMFNHLLAVNYRSAYHDQEYTSDDAAVREVNADGTYGAFVDMNTHKVKAYTTFDWQSEMTWMSFVGRIGIKNLLNRKPPLSIQNAGGGNQIGYDGRYADPLGRQYYLSLSYKF